MAMSVVYASVNGRLVQENRAGAVTRYVPDTLGSVIQTRDSSGNQSSSTSYWPFGEVRASSGTNPSCWGFVGTLGYYKDALARLYVRARSLRVDLSRWLTVDPLWPQEDAYAYASSNPLLRTDPTGLNFDGCPEDHPVRQAWEQLKAKGRARCTGEPYPGRDCWAECGEKDIDKEAECFCKHLKGDAKYPIQFTCPANGDQKCNTKNGKPYCMGAKRGGTGTDCQVFMCLENCPPGLDWQSALFHEVMHCCGAGHGKPGSDVRTCQAEPDCLEKCLRPIFGFGIRPGPVWSDILDGW